MPQQQGPLTGANALAALPRMLVARFSSDRCFQVAGSLTFTALLALVPLITVALSVASLFPVYEDVTDALRRFLVDNILPHSIEVIATYTRQFAQNAARLTVVGVLFLVVTAVMLLHTIEDEFNQIWRVTRPRSLPRRVFIYLTLLTLGPVLIGASLSLTSLLVSLSLGLAREVPAFAVFLLESVPVILTSVAFALIYLTLPNRRVPPVDACLGGAAAGAGFELMKEGFALYLAHFPTYQLIYGAFAAIPVFLVWIYLSWLLMIGGAVLVAVLPEWRAGAWRAVERPGSDFVVALALLKRLHAEAAGPVPLGVLCAHAQLPAERAERLLNAMSAANLISRTGVETWAPRRSAGDIRLIDLYEMFVFAPAAMVAARTEGLGEWLHALACGAERAAKATLADWLATREPTGEVAAAKEPAAEAATS